ncbi:hypothetical protein COY23_01025, partial [bacterium (Candidatus Torokbacteria) CG_4_10_14_0_2_um_filter_35_8]
MNLADQQKSLKLSLIDCDLDKMRHVHPLISQLHEGVIKFLPQGLYDPQDLEHQTLFRLTTFDPKDITDQVIKDVINEQCLIIEDRLKNSKFDLEYLFRGLTGKSNDLNIKCRLQMTRNNNTVFATSENGIVLEVLFKKVEEEEIINLFTNDLHYIHEGRTRGETFGLYFAYDKLPWAIETTESSILAKEYKQKALLAHGIDPNKAMELTRLYTLPGSPRNAISILDGLIRNYYLGRGLEAIYTTVMPMYSKTKGATISGGIDKVLLVKDLRHKFVAVQIGEKTCYRQATTAFINNNQIDDYLVSHKNFPLMSVVEVFTYLNKPPLEPLPILKDDKKAIYIPLTEREDGSFHKNIEVETKFLIDNVSEVLGKLADTACYKGCEYIRDTIYNLDDARLRLRVKNNFEKKEVEAMFKHRVGDGGGLKVEVEELVYKGDNLEEALKKIKSLGEFVEYNSYEKIRLNYEMSKPHSHLTLDIYPYGAWLEIEDDESAVWKNAEKLGFKKEESTGKNADELYEEWCRKNKLDILW